MTREPDASRADAIDVGSFDAVDRAATPEQFATWMDAQRAAFEDRSYEALAIRHGDVVLDVGCGTGVDASRLARLTDAVVGVDLSVTMATTARARVAGTRAAIAVADAQRLPFEGASFDAVMCRAVLIHAPDPRAAVREIARVLRPGGKALFSEPDHGSHLVGCDGQDVVRRLLEHRRSRFRHPLIGRRLVQLGVDAGLSISGTWVQPILHRTLASAVRAGGPFGIAVEDAVRDRAITTEEARRYVASLEALDRRGAFFFAAAAVTVLAQKRVTGC